MQAVIDGRNPSEIAALHRNKAKRAEIEKCASVEIPNYLQVYLQEVLVDVRSLNQRIIAMETSLLAKIETFNLHQQIDLMCTVPGVSKMLALRVISEMGANYHQRYFTAEAFSKAIRVVPSNEVSGESCSNAGLHMATSGSSFTSFPQPSLSPFTDAALCEDGSMITEVAQIT